MISLVSGTSNLMHFVGERCTVEGQCWQVELEQDCFYYYSFQSSICMYIFLSTKDILLEAFLSQRKLDPQREQCFSS